MNFTRAIARSPTTNAGDGLTSAGLGTPDTLHMLAQHRDYLRILESLGLQDTRSDGRPVSAATIEQYRAVAGKLVDTVPQVAHMHTMC